MNYIPMDVYSKKYINIYTFTRSFYPFRVEPVTELRGNNNYRSIFYYSLLSISLFTYCCLMIIVFAHHK